MKSKGEKERYTHLNAEFHLEKAMTTHSSTFAWRIPGTEEEKKKMNAEFQRIARRDKKAFLSDQCKEIEENNRMGKTRALFKKIRDIKGTFHARIGMIKDRKGKDLTEAEEIKKR